MFFVIFLNSFCFNLLPQNQLAGPTAIPCYALFCFCSKGSDRLTVQHPPAYFKSLSLFLHLIILFWDWVEDLLGKLLDRKTRDHQSLRKANRSSETMNSYVQQVMCRTPCSTVKTVGEYQRKHGIWWAT